MNNAMKNLNVKKRIFLLVVAVVLLLLFLAVPMDHFSHGFYCEPLDTGVISQEDWLGTIDLSEPYDMGFVVDQRHFAGFEIFLMNDADGELIISTYDKNVEMVEMVTVDLSKVPAQSWYMVNTNRKYKKGQEYSVSIVANNSENVPVMALVDNGYLRKESNGNQLLIDYGYAKSSFNTAEKTVFVILALALLCFLYAELWLSDKSNGVINKSKLRVCALFMALVSVFTWNYMFNSFDEENAGEFPTFQDLSDSLIMNVIQAQQDGIALSRYGLGELLTLDGSHFPVWNQTFRSDEAYLNGYSLYEPKISIANNEGSDVVAVMDYTIRFANGEEYQMVNVENMGGEYEITLNADGPLNFYKYGDLSEAMFFSPDGQQQFPGLCEPYISQFGLQGKIFRKMAALWQEENVEKNLWLVCSLAAAIVFAIITILVGYKFNVLMSFVFGTTFLLSPWIVNYSNSVYWVEAIWFLPMLTGLICSIWIENKLVRIGSYVMAFVTIFAKSLCGYEYMTTVMLGLISFLLVDLIVEWCKGDKNRAKLLFRTTFIVGVMALMGFVIAITLHATIRGEGSIVAGIKSIIERDVLRRVGGGSLNDFAEEYWESLNASKWEALKMYFHFPSDVIAGIDANQFPLMCLLPVVIFIYDYIKGRLNIKNVTMYVVFFLTSISWHIMAKSHSYYHPNMNYILWYFGYVQICLYVILDKIYQLMTGKKSEEK